MTDLEIKQYLYNNNWTVNPQDFLMNVLNTSNQIIDEHFDFEKHIYTIITHDNVFTVKWDIK